MWPVNEVILVLCVFVIVYIVKSDWSDPND